MRYSIIMRCDGVDWYWSVVDENDKIVQDNTKHYSFFHAQTAAKDAEVARLQWQDRSRRK